MPEEKEPPRLSNDPFRIRSVVDGIKKLRPDIASRENDHGLGKGDQRIWQRLQMFAFWLTYITRDDDQNSK